MPAPVPGSSSSGKGGQLLPLASMVGGWETLLRLPDWTTDDLTYQAVATDWFFGGFPPPVTEIPYAWITGPGRFRADLLFNLALVTRGTGATARARDNASAAEYGESEFTATLSTSTAQDPPNLAAHMVGNYAPQPSGVPRQRCPQLTINLLQVYDLAGPTGVWRVLGRRIGDRISISGTPTTPATAWPQGTTAQVIEGIKHAIAVDTRTVTWSMAPVIGTTPGTPGPWFRADVSTAGPAATDKLPF